MSPRLALLPPRIIEALPSVYGAEMENIVSNPPTCGCFEWLPLTRYRYAQHALPSLRQLRSFRI